MFVIRMCRVASLAREVADLIDSYDYQVSSRDDEILVMICMGG